MVECQRKSGWLLDGAVSDPVERILYVVVVTIRFFAGFCHYYVSYFCLFSFFRFRFIMFYKVRDCSFF